MDIRKTIRNEMNRQDISQGDLSRVCAVDNSHLGKFLRGERQLKVSRIEAICDHLGLELKRYQKNGGDNNS